MIDFELGVLIDRPIHDVFAFVATPTNLPRWQSGSKEVKQTSPGPVGVGATFQNRGEIMGRPLDGQMEITTYEPDTQFGFKGVNGPMTMHAAIHLKSVGTGTKLTIALHAEPGGFFKLAEGVLVKQIKSQFETNLDQLKAVLEGGAS
jgi:uncharacterized protein YndB with AHSA1/START domain